ncbi:MAG: hypothetical protein A2X94_06595 [Bdellovibrionales bacterium GWB1_55_8]|nr:MAG: hypothetical protein A2X94_06595 [Bdellovibrionales bacterium GWB1_55_8]
MIARRVIVSGRVQGVGYRAAAERQARKYSGLQGYVKNLEDGRVEALFVGETSSVLALVSWCKEGPPAAQVRELRVIEENVETAKNLSGGIFQVAL